MEFRRNRSSYVTDTESSEDEFEDMFPQRNKYTTHKTHEDNCPDQKSSRHGRNKCLTKNAMIARESRRKKKMYIKNLEEEVRKLKESKNGLKSVIDNQSFLILDLRKEIKYLKSVLANCSDISNLIKNVRCSSGMSVTTSLNKSLTLKNYCVSKPQTNIPRKTAHPWEDQFLKDGHSIGHQEDSASITSPEQDIVGDFPISDSLSDFNLPFDIDMPYPNYEFDPILLDISSGTPDELNIPSNITCTSPLNEHNYTNVPRTNDCFDDQDVGVCLHVSKHQVSLEFCSSCSENALQTWKEME